MTDAPRSCETLWLGCVTYDDGLELQERSVRERTAGDAPDRLLLLEHPPVLTLGRGANRENVLASEAELAALGARIYHTGRGGDVTYHGPGQLVGYPVILLKPDRCDVHRYVRDLEEVLIRVLAELGISGERIAGLTGVWVGGEKVAAIGVRIARWVTSHGFALNVSTDLSHYRAIVPCGISDRGVTSVERLTGVRYPLDEIAALVAARFGDVFERRITHCDRSGVDQPARA
ncbi:MAG TPA: lipoyl(octanoyl) transferase LipB [Blastocatellia bacterium]|nr:lipoyl(octanoyl) transferase LipB [Blastocatellia bacterium]